ncbi:MAG: PA14 domain-containing protein [Bernardetiaceae bacterium]|jgi:outer membrane protein OmpA-like peptidoglycan-associated protein|nr:PA14 domain-containing protein [Bernardetiaceae bacterium]
MRRSLLLSLICWAFIGGGTPIALAQPQGKILPGYSPGFLGEYFADTVFRNKVHTRLDANTDMNYWLDSPAPGIYTDKYAVRWTGRLTAPQTGRYTLQAIADDGVRVWIGGKLVMNEWRLQKANRILVSPPFKLTQNQQYEVKVEYFNGKTANYLRLYWAFEEEEPTPLDKRHVQARPPGQVGPGPQLAKKADKKVPAEATASLKKPAAEAKPKKPAGQSAKPQTEARAETVAALPKPEPPKPSTYEGLTPGETVVIENLQFEQSSYKLTGNYQQVLERLLNTLKKYPQLAVTIIGHTDNVGQADKNLRLSQQRAGVVKTYLVAHGIAEPRLQAVGQGGQQPVAPNQDEAGRQKNRRVEFKVQ